MQIKTDFPRAIRAIENTWIPLADGMRLAARIWLPADAERHPVPAILEYLPYRKNDATAGRDAIQHPYFAGHGYAAIRVDMRGSGDSDGILYDEYLPQEQEDALEVLAWIAAQPWCTGAVGMMGISWGGFNSLQVAARRPPELKAIVSLCSTDDRYADDVHYMGGCLLAVAQLRWASSMFAHTARPPDPRFVGERWREIWLERMARTPPFIEAWLTHQRRDAFWRQGSVCENYAGITCPVYAIGGWADAYTNTVLRLLAGLPGPRKGLIGPWAHMYPELGLPGPAMGFLQECLRWWDTWLRGIDTGIMDEPMLRVWMQESVAPGDFYTERPGRWVAEPAWPSPNVQEQTYRLTPGATLAPEPAAGFRNTENTEVPQRTQREPRASEMQVAFQGHPFAGTNAGVWCPYGRPGDLPTDQRAEDGVSLAFTSAPLEEAVEILGFPEIMLDIAVDRPNALVAVRLCDVSPTGASTLVTRGFLNLTHRESHATPSPLEPGRRYTVTVRCNAIAHRLLAGHRWRVAISPTYWPWMWPSPEPVTLTLFMGDACRLELPVRGRRAEDDQLVSFAPAEGAKPLAVEVLRTPTQTQTYRYDVLHKQLHHYDETDGGCQRLLDSGLEHESSSRNSYILREDDPLSAYIRCERTAQIGRGEWRTRIETVSTMSADAAQFYVTNVLEAYEGHTRVFAKTWNFTVARDLV